jgi:hypothetical protein
MGRNPVQIKKVLTSRLVTVAAGATIVGLVGAGAGWSAAQITSADIANDTILSKDVHDGTLKTEDFKDKTVDELRGAPGPQGPAGPIGPQGPADNGETVVNSLSAAKKFEATNASVSLTPDGVEMGPYADGAAQGGSIYFSGLNGQKLSAVKSLSYYLRTTATSNGDATPYLRIFLNNDNDDVIFSANTQSPDADTDEGEFNEYVATSGSVRYDDDPGNNPSAEAPFSTIQAAHANDTISGIYITGGFGGASTDVNVLLRWLEINGIKYAFRSN